MKMIAIVLMTFVVLSGESVSAGDYFDETGIITPGHCISPENQKELIQSVRKQNFVEFSRMYQSLRDLNAKHSGFPELPWEICFNPTKLFNGKHAMTDIGMFYKASLLYTMDSNESLIAYQLLTVFLDLEFRNQFMKRFVRLDIDYYKPSLEANDCSSDFSNVCPIAYSSEEVLWRSGWDKPRAQLVKILRLSISINASWKDVDLALQKYVYDQ
jgi:hypothetical protein